MLAVVGLVIGGIWWAASAVSDSIKVNQTISGIALFNADIRKVFNRVSGVDANIPLAVFSNIPTGWVAVDANHIKSPHGANIGFQIMTNSVSAAGDRYFVTAHPTP